MDVILEGLSNSMKTNIVKCTSSRVIWEKLKNIYMIEEVIKTSKKYESISSNENDKNVKVVLLMNEPSQDEDIIQKDTHGE